jgi:tetratricopeptide (TPR) repeat protein
MLPWLRRIRRPRPAAPSEEGQRHLRAIRHLVIDEATTAIHRALERRDHPAAERAIAQALRIDAASPRLAELRAWYHLDLNQPQVALDILDAVPRPSPQLKLLLQLVRSLAGAKARAHLALNSWARHRDCPPAARVLLAALDAEAGHTGEALAVLNTDPELAADPRACCLQILLEGSRDVSQAARRAGAILLRRFGRHQHVTRFLDSLDLARRSDATVPIEMIGQLAEELLDQPQVIESLVVAQQCHPQPLRIELLRRAIARIVDQLAEPIAALEALALLGYLAGDHDEAMRWVRRGMKIAPMNVRLALLADELERGTTDASPELSTTLRHLAEAHPGYPDLQRALIHRYHRRNNRDAALRHLAQWQHAQPDHPLAQRTRQELAA